MLSRRTVVLGSLPVALLPLTASVAAASNPFAAIERRHGGRLGVFVHDLGTGRTLGHRDQERFKLYSIFKGLLAGLVLADVAAGAETLDAMVRYGAGDLLDASPITSARVGEGALSVRTLCEAMMHRSDNAAANLLMRRRGGPARLTAFLRRIGDRQTRVDHYEGALSGKPLPLDSTAPRALVGSAAALITGRILPEEQRSLLEQWLIGNQVGSTRLRAAFPQGWVSGDRTGTGDGICNDYAFARRPGRGLLVVSALYEAPGMSMADQEAVLREVGREVVHWDDMRDARRS